MEKLYDPHTRTQIYRHMHMVVFLPFNINAFPIPEPGQTQAGLQSEKSLIYASIYSEVIIKKTTSTECVDSCFVQEAVSVESVGLTGYFSAHISKPA